MFPYSCPFCSQRLLALPDRVGQRTICPKCLRPLTIPRPDHAGDDPDHDPTIDLDAPPPPRPAENGYAARPHDDPAEVSLSTALPPEEPEDLDLAPDTASDFGVLGPVAGPPADRELPDDEVDLGMSEETPPPIELMAAPARPPAGDAALPPVAPPPPPRATSPPTVKMPRPERAPERRPEREPPQRLRPPAAPAAAAPAAGPGSGTGYAGPRAHSPLPPRATARSGNTPGGASPGLPNGLLTGVPPDPRDAPRPAPARLPRHETGTVSLMPTGMTGVDINAELTANLTMRMKPRPEPAADLALSTGGWLLTCVAAAALWLAGVLFEPRLLPFVAVVGGLMLAFGYLWAAYLAGRLDARRGLLTLLPPVALWRVTQPFGQNGYAPLRFVLGGALALGMAYAGGPAREGVASALSALSFERATPPASRVTASSRLAAAAADRQADAALAEMVNLATPEYRAELPAEETPKVVAALKELAAPETCARSDVRLKATALLLEWSEADGRAALARALQSPELTERRGAMALAPRWADDAIALAIARRLGQRGEESNAREALSRMPPARAETALLPVLVLDPENAVGLLTVAEMLERVGGQRTLDALTALSQSSKDALVRDELARHAEAVRKRLAAK